MRYIALDMKRRYTGIKAKMGYTRTDTINGIPTYNTVVKYYNFDAKRRYSGIFSQMRYIKQT